MPKTNEHAMTDAEALVFWATGKAPAGKQWMEDYLTDTTGWGAKPDVQEDEDDKAKYWDFQW